MFRSRRWNRYVWGELLTPTLLGLLLWTFLLLMNAFFLIAEKAMSKNFGWALAFRMFGYEIPQLLVMSIPMAVLLGGLIAVGRLSADHEWVALQGAGHGPSRVLRPLLTFGLLASLISFGIYLFVVPRASYAKRALQGEAIFLSNLASDLRPGVLYTQLPGTVMFVENIRPGADGLEGMIIHRSNPQQDGRDQLIVARSGGLYPHPEGAKDRKLSVRLKNAESYVYGPDADDQDYLFWRKFAASTDYLPTPPYLENLLEAPTKTVLDIGPVALWREYERARDDTAGHPAQREMRLRTVKFEIHRRIALPLASVLFVFIALPLGVTRARSGRGAGLALSFLVILIYWIVFTAGQARAMRGGLPPWAGAWGATIVLLAWGLFGYWRLRRNRGGGLFDGVFGLLRRLFSSRRPSAAPASSAETPGDEEGYGDAMSHLGGTTTRFIALLDRYVGRRFVWLTGVTLGGAFLVHAIVDLKRLLEGVFKSGQPFSRVLLYYVYALPEMLNMALPVACMVGGIITFTLLARTGELTAIKASGINMRRAIVPVLLVTIVCCVLLFLVQDKVTPGASVKAEEIKDQLLGRSPVTYAMPAGGKWAFGPGGQHLYHYREYDPDREVFRRLDIFTLDRSVPRVLEHRFCSEASWDGERWTLGEGWRRVFLEPFPESLFEKTAETSTDQLDPPESFTRREAVLSARNSRLQDQMSIQELADQIDTLTASGYDTTRLEVAYWGKWAQPLAPLVMVLLGLPFAFKVGRRGSLYGIGVAIVLVIVYWATFAVFNALGLETILPPLLAAWTPNILYGLLGTYLLLFIST